MENTKLTAEELEKLQDIQQRNVTIANELGNLEITKLQVEARKAEILKYFNELKEEEQTLGKELSDKYGVGTINMEAGEFIPAPVAE